MRAMVQDIIGDFTELHSDQKRTRLIALCDYLIEKNIVEIVKEWRDALLQGFGFSDDGLVSMYTVLMQMGERLQDMQSDYQHKKLADIHMQVDQQKTKDDAEADSILDALSDKQVERHGKH